MKYTTTLLTLNSPNHNDRIYPSEVIEKAIEKSRKDMEERRLFVTSHLSLERSEVNLEDAVGMITDIKIEGDNLIGEAEFSPVLLSKHFPIHLPSFESQFNKTLFLRPSGMGTVKDGLIGDDYIINHFFLTNDPA